MSSLESKLDEMLASFGVSAADLDALEEEDKKKQQKGGRKDDAKGSAAGEGKKKGAGDA